METAITFISLLAAIAQVVATFYFIRQLRTMQESNFTVAFKTVYDILQTDEIRTARRHVITKLKEKPYQEWDEMSDKAAASKVCQSYDFIGNMIKNGLFPEEIICDSWGPSLRQCYPVLKPYLEEIRLKSNSKEVWDDFELLSHKANHYQKSVA